MKKPLYLLVIFSLTAVSAIYLISIVIAYPLIGLKVTPVNSEQCVVTEVYPNGWANYQNIKRQQLIYCEPNSNHAFKLEKVNEMILPTNERVSVTYKAMPASYLIYSFLPIIYFILSFSIVLYLFFKIRLSKVSKMSSYLLLFISLAYLGSGVSARGDIFGLFITTLSLYVIPVLLLEYLRMMIPKKDPQVATLKMVLLYGFVFILALITTLTGVSKFILLPFVLLILVNLLYFIVQFHSIKKSIHFVKVRFFTGTFFLSLLPYILLTAVSEVLFEKQIVMAEHTALFLLFIPLSFVYANVKKVFLDFDWLIKSSLINIFLSLLPACLLAGTVYAKEGHSIFVFQVWLMAMVLIPACLFTKDFFAVYLLRSERKFHSSLTKLSQKSSQLHNEQALFLYVNQMIRDVLQVDDVKKVRYDSKELTSQSLNIGDLQQMNTGYALLVSQNSVAYTFITFSYKGKNTQLNKKEKSWLISVAHYTNIFIENLKKTEELVAEIEKLKEGSVSPTISRTLFLIGEKERVKLAQDIHDSILQELIFIYKNIEIIQNRDEQYLPSLEKVKFQLNEQINFIRETCYDLNPFFLKDIGLIDTLSTLLDRYRKTCTFEIDFQVSHVNHFADLSEEFVLVLYRIVQEWMNNAKKHSKANFIYISLSYRHDNFVLIYEDDGIGFNLNKENNGKHFGLIGLNERIQSLNGNLSIHTEPQQGLLLRVTIPNQRDDIDD
ncbi:ATP-binding protein [Bacillus sp. REN10]|uniref:ATP-binding protein n=1 Tax=Bacillus sp. REN10 TaxID=2782541 RepID=UPI00193C73A5